MKRIIRRTAANLGIVALVTLVTLASLPAHAGPDTAAIDARVGQFMDDKNVDGLTLAIAKRGKLVYAKGYGDTGEPTPDGRHPVTDIETNSLFRVASLSKAITAVAVMHLLDDGRLGSAGLDSKIFGYGSIFGSKYKPWRKRYTSDIRSLTVRHLLEMSAGEWGPGGPMFFGGSSGTHDPYRYPRRKYQLVASDNPQDWTHDELIRFVIEEVIDNPFRCDDRFWKTNASGGMNYSNFNYALLGRVIEEVTGRDYETYVKEEILQPLGIIDMHVAGRSWTDLRPEETNYMSKQAFHRNVERFDAHGGWIATARDVVKFGVRAESLLSATSWDTMLTRDAHDSRNNQFKKGWWTTRPDGRAFQIKGAGSMPGSKALLLMEGDYTVALIINRQRKASLTPLAQDLIDLDTDWTRWDVVYTGSSGWNQVGQSNASLLRLRFGDFDGDGRADVFERTHDGAWQVSYVDGGTTAWRHIGRSTSADLENMHFADFDGDGRTDIFKRENDGSWYVSYTVDDGTSGWHRIGRSTSANLKNMRFADFDGDGRTDIFKRENDGSWYVSYTVDDGTSGWRRIGRSTSTNLENMRLGDFDGDGRADVFKRNDDGSWYVSYTVDRGTSGWHRIGRSTSANLDTMRFGDFDGDGRTDIFKREDDGGWYVAYTVNGGTSGWHQIGYSTSSDLATMRFADFDGDGRTDIFRVK